MASYEKLKELIVAGRKDEVADEVKSLLADKKEPLDIVTNGLVGSLSVVGDKWKTGDMYIPEVMLSAHAMQEGMSILKPLTVGTRSPYSKGKVVMGTVEGDVHSIGKNIVIILMESAGFEVVDLGVNVPASKFVESVQKEKPKILGLSALITTTVPQIKKVIEALKMNDVRDKVIVMVGGAPLRQDIADAYGADGYAPDAISAVEKTKQLID
ncbi:B12-binding domain-containing protein [Chloroflexota bacterium]